MGTLSYGYPEHVCEIDDRTLAHLQIVIIDKLRRGETFCFTCLDGCARTTYWFSPGIPLRFGFTEPCRIGINRAWVAALELSAQTVQGLRVVEEPLDTSPRPVARPLRERSDAVNA